MEQNYLLADLPSCSRHDVATAKQQYIFSKNIYSAESTFIATVAVGVSEMDRTLRSASPLTKSDLVTVTVRVMWAYL